VCVCGVWCVVCDVRARKLLPNYEINEREEMKHRVHC